MAYTRTNWIPEETPLSAANFNNIEDGIEEAKAAATGNETLWTYIRDKISSILGLTETQYNGNAATATTAASATNATNATNAAKVNNHTVNSDVPVNAKFTDTNTWNANSKTVAGYVAAPGAVANKVWKTDASGNPAWRDDANTTYAAATTSAAGLMSAADKTKMNGIATGAEVNQNAFSNVKVGSTTVAADSKTDTLVLAAGSNVTLTPDATNDKVTISATNTTYAAATTSAAGLMSAADKTKLNGIATGANKIQRSADTVMRDTIGASSFLELSTVVSGTPLAIVYAYSSIPEVEVVGTEITSTGYITCYLRNTTNTSKTVNVHFAYLFAN